MRPSGKPHPVKARLISGYQSLLRRLSRRLGSPELAAEALHETWIRLERGQIGDVANPDAYLYRAALNTATNIRLAEGRRLKAAEIETLLDIPDEGPDLHRIVEAKLEIERLEAAVAELPPRQQAVLREMLFGSASFEEMAAAHKVSLKTIYNDVNRAMNYCAGRLGKDVIYKFGRKKLSD